MSQKSGGILLHTDERTSFPWYALRVQQKFERVTSAILCEKGYDAYVPDYESSRQWSDRRKVIRLSLIPGYVFCRLDVNRRLDVLMTPRVLHMVGLGKVPVSISDDEMESVRRLVECGRQLGAHPYLSVGDRVRVERGALAGLEGHLVQVKNGARIVVSIHLLQRSIAAEIDLGSITPVSKQTAHRDLTPAARLAS